MAGPSQPPIPTRKGRGALSNPEGRFETRRVEAFDDGWSHEDASELPPLPTTVTAEHAKSILTRNDSPDIGFEVSINPYRGCEHGCVYCARGDTLILMADGSTRPLAELAVGEEICGTERVGHYRRYVRTRVLMHWRTTKLAFRVTLADGTSLVASGDHRFLTERGWKFVDQGLTGQRPHLTTNNSLLGFGSIRSTARAGDSPDFRQGYLCGMIRGDGTIGSYQCFRANGKAYIAYPFRLALADDEGLARTTAFLAGFGIQVRRGPFQAELSNRKRMDCIRTSTRASHREISRLIAWPDRVEGNWARGFLGGLFDAEGSHSGGTVRIANGNPRIVQMALDALTHLGFRAVVETVNRPRPMHYVRLLGGLRSHIDFFRTCNPAIARKRSIVGQALKSTVDLRVVEIEPLDGEQDLYDITTGTGDFIANGVVSHNCYARPMHSYVNLSPGLDFETRLFYKAGAAELLDRELRKRSYVCKPVNLGAATDPYQPIERKLRVTRSILEVLQRFRNPLTIVTKSSLVERDIDVLGEMAAQNLLNVYVSITTLDAGLKRTLEPRAPSPAARLQAVRRLREAGIPVGVLIAPIIPAVNDAELEHIVAACAQAGAGTVGYVLLRLPYEVKDLFREWLETHMPLRAAHVMSLIQSMRGGRDNDPRFGRRMRGEGPFADLLRTRFAAACKRHGLARTRETSLSTDHFRVPGAVDEAGGQLSLL